MDRDELSFHAHAARPIAAPVGDEAVDALLSQLQVTGGGRVLDVGCGSGEWLLRLALRTTGLTGVGVDRSGWMMVAARSRAMQLGLSDRLQFVQGNAAGFLSEQPPHFDAALCIGSSHALGGPVSCLKTLHRLPRLETVLFGESHWQATPTPAALEALGAGPEDLPDLERLRATARDAGFDVTHERTSDQEEWDAYERAWCEGLEQFAAAAPEGERAQAARAAAEGHRQAYLNGYRGVLGFTVLVLRRARR